MKFYINLAAKDLTAVRAFYESLGLQLNNEYTSEQNVAFDIGDGARLMISEESFLGEGDARSIADTSKVYEVVFSLELNGRQEADRLFEAGIAAGGKKAGEATENAEFNLYTQHLYDPAGHKIDLVAIG